MFIFGHEDNELENIVKVIKKQFPQIQIVGYQNGFLRDPNLVIKAINEATPDLVLVATGMPRQEDFVLRLKEETGVKMSFAIGATLLYTLGLRKEAPKIVRDLWLEWAWRWAHEPARLTERYLFGNSVVIYLFFKNLLERLSRK